MTDRPQRAIGYMNAARQALRRAQYDAPFPSEIYSYIQDLITQTYEVEDAIRHGAE